MPVVLRVVVPAEHSAPGAGEGEARRMDEHQIEPREQIEPLLEEPFLPSALTETDES